MRTGRQMNVLRQDIELGKYRDKVLLDLIKLPMQEARHLPIFTGLERVLKNLTGSAIRYTPAYSVLVTARKSNNMARIEGPDPGIGVKMKLLVYKALLISE